MAEAILDRKPEEELQKHQARLDRAKVIVAAIESDGFSEAGPLNLETQDPGLFLKNYDRVGRIKNRLINHAIPNASARIAQLSGEISQPVSGQISEPAQIQEPATEATQISFIKPPTGWTREQIAIFEKSREYLIGISPVIASRVKEFTVNNGLGWEVSSVLGVVADSNPDLRWGYVSAVMPEKSSEELTDEDFAILKQFVNSLGNDFRLRVGLGAGVLSNRVAPTFYLKPIFSNFVDKAPQVPEQPSQETPKTEGQLEWEKLADQFAEGSKTATEAGQVDEPEINSDSATTDEENEVNSGVQDEGTIISGEDESQTRQINLEIDEAAREVSINGKTIKIENDLDWEIFQCIANSDNKKPFKYGDAELRSIARKYGYELEASQDLAVLDSLKELSRLLNSDAAKIIIASRERNLGTFSFNADQIVFVGGDQRDSSVDQTDTDSDWEYIPYIPTEEEKRSPEETRVLEIIVSGLLDHNRLWFQEIQRDLSVLHRVDQVGGQYKPHTYYANELKSIMERSLNKLNREESRPILRDQWNEMDEQLANDVRRLMQRSGVDTSEKLLRKIRREIETAEREYFNEHRDENYYRSKYRQD